MAKFKVGDKVKVVRRSARSNERNKNDYINNIFTINKVSSWVTDNFPYYLGGTGYWWCDEELELAEFTKADLKDGMVVEYADGDRHMFLNGTFVDLDTYMSVNGYDDNLIYCGAFGPDKSLDIVKVYKAKKTLWLKAYFRNDNLELLWERPKEEPVKEMTVAEIEKELGYKVKVVAEE